MSYSTMMHEYFDRTLDGAHEDVLFAELGRNPELRREFTEHMMLRTAVHNDITAIRTPVESTRHIFGALGFALPLADEIAPPGFFSQFLARYSSRIATALVSSFATALIFLGLGTMNEKNSSMPAEKNFAQVPANSEEKISSEENISPEKNSIADEKNSSERISRARNISLPPAENPSAEQENTESERANISPSLLEAPSAAQENILRANTAPGGKIYSPYNLSSLLRNYDITANIRYSTPLSNEIRLRNPGKETINNNISADLMFYRSGEYTFGVSFGKENFSQEFTLNSSARSITVRQNPSFIWTALSANYQFDPVFDYVTPFAMVSAGITLNELYPFGRIIGGLQVPLTQNFSFSGGLEASGLLYSTSQKNVLSTGKYGVNFGLNYKF